MAFDPSTLSALTPLIAVIVSPAATLYVAKKQLQASVVSNNRQAWINRLRDEVASLTAFILSLPSAHAADSITTSAAMDMHANFVKMAQSVKLLANPSEPDHQELIRLIDLANADIIRSINQRIANANQFSTSAETIINKTQTILKQEWIRVKQGK